MKDYLITYNSDSANSMWLRKILEESSDPLKESEKDDCGTVGCIAGFCVLTICNDKEDGNIKAYEDMEDQTGRAYLGITEKQGDQLFTWEELSRDKLPSK